MNEKNKIDSEKEKKKIQPSVTNDDQKGDFLERRELTKCNEPPEKNHQNEKKKKILIKNTIEKIN